MKKDLSPKINLFLLESLQNSSAFLLVILQLPYQHKTFTVAVHRAIRTVRSYNLIMAVRNCQMHKC